MMGLLYTTAMLERWKREHVLNELKKMDVTHTAAGKPIDELSYQDLKEQLVLACFKQIDAESDSSKWF